MHMLLKQSFFKVPRTLSHFVCLYVTRMLCDKTKQCTADILIGLPFWYLLGSRLLRSHARYPIPGLERARRWTSSEADKLGYELLRQKSVIFWLMLFSMADRLVAVFLHRVSKKNYAKLFLSELHHISANFDNFWQKDGKGAEIVRGALISHLIRVTHYRVRKCSKLLHNAVIISIRLFAFASSIR